jgi:asparagine synthase (glutamine-hydrolysing)
MPVLNDNLFNWKSGSKESITALYKGSTDIAHAAFDAVEKADDKDKIIKQLSIILQNLHDYTGGIIETDNYIIGWADHIRTWPLFYTQINDNFFLSQNAYLIKEKIPDADYDPVNLTEFKMGGYVTGKESLVKNLFCLNPGEFCIWDKKEKLLSLHKYYSYLPSFDSTTDKKIIIQQLDKLFDDLTHKIIDRCGGRPIWIPLSGGLDSRILLCKLNQHGYRNIQTFTYGPRFNFESFIARRIAKKLNVPWRFVSVPSEKLRQYFESNDRKSFWEFAGNLKTMPCMREYGALRFLREKNLIPADAVFLNGQSGDYITGNHISAESKNAEIYDEDLFYKIIINKHYDLWKSLKTPENISLLKHKINDIVKTASGEDVEVKDGLSGARAEEIWEYEGRQICYVANGQRIYEYFGYDWEMPLWEKDFVDFFEPLPFDMKFGQNIYKEYLRSYNYKNLFPDKEPYIWRWPLPMLWVIPLAQVIGLGGRKIKNNFYAFMRYWGHYANQYAFIDFEQHRKSIRDSRNIISLYVEKWLSENPKP